MRDVHIAGIAGRQHNRISRAQLVGLGLSSDAIVHRIQKGRLVPVEAGVYAVAPVLDDPWGRWMGATLTAPGSVLSHSSAAVAYGWVEPLRPYETVTRPGSGGPRRFGDVRVHRSSTLAGDRTELRGVPITTPARTLIDIVPREPVRVVARSVREAVRLEQTTLAEVGDALGRHRGRRGTRRLARVLSSYIGVPLERARSGAEVQAMLVLRDAGVRLPRLNVEVAGLEADLSWPAARLIVEIDGAPFHQDRGEDARKEAAWRAAGWAVRRLPSDAVFTEPARLVALANVPK